MYQAPEKPCESSAVTEEQQLASQTLSQCCRLECPYFVSRDGEQRLRGVDGIVAGGTVSCFNVGSHGRFILCFTENLAKPLFDDSAICAAVAIK